MALPGSGPLSFSAIQTEFGGSNPIALSEYYRGGAYVGSGAPNVPTSGAIALSTFYSAQAAVVLNITSSTSNYNILTAATAAGYNAATDTTPIIVNVAGGVVVSGSGTYAMRTGVLNASSSLTINITGSINGYTGQRGSRYTEYNSKSNECNQPFAYGSYGATGAAGGFGLAGATGGTGTWGGGYVECPYIYPGAGGAGGAAGFALRKNGKTVTINNSGTIAGSTA